MEMKIILTTQTNENLATRLLLAKLISESGRALPSQYGTAADEAGKIQAELQRRGLDLDEVTSLTRDMKIRRKAEGEFGQILLLHGLPADGSGINLEL
jgi:hypothetical protein